MRFFSKKVTNASKRGSYRLTVAALCLLMAFGVFLLKQQQANAVRFQNRSLYINSSVASATTFYTATFTYPTIHSVGSVSLLFCTEAIAYLPCDAPQGLNLSGATLSTQSGETGFTLTQATANKLVISRPAVVNSIQQSKYTFTNVVNPSVNGTFYVRLNSYASSDASGAFIDYGSIASSIATQLTLETQVPPWLIFCTAKVIPTDCSDAPAPTVDQYVDPQPDETSASTNEMMAYTNARGGYVITMLGRSLTSGIYEIPAIQAVPEDSIPGKGQFGINLTDNDNPNIGADPTGSATNVTLNPDYTQSDKFLFNDGDILATSDWVTRYEKFTVSYIVNIPPDQHPGVYNTTVTFICTGNF
jgi:hypothetical protein